MSKTIIWIIVLVVIIAGIVWFMSQPAPEAPVTGDEKQTEEERSIVVALSAQNDSGMSGTATLTEMDGSTVVKTNLTGAPQGVSQPAHIHIGSCENIGEVAYPLESPVNGVSETTLSASLETILGKLPLALNVHKSAEEVSVYVACGNLIAN